MKTAKPWSFIIRRFAKVHGARALRSIEARELTKYLNDVYDAARLKGKDGRSTFNNGRSGLRHFFEWAVAQKYVETNPVSEIETLDYVPDHRLLGIDEISRYLAALRKMRHAQDEHSLARLSVSNFLWLIALTGCRLDELASATIAHFLPVERKRLIPASRAKNRENHYPGISYMAARVVQSQLALLTARGLPTTRTSLLFPAKAALKRLLKRHGTGLGRMTNHVIYNHHAEVAASAGIEAFHIHDFRRIFTTLAAELGVHGEFRNLLVSHGTRTRAEKTYQKYDFLKEMQESASRIAVALDFYSSNRNGGGLREPLECRDDFVNCYDFWVSNRGIDFAANEANCFELGGLVSSAMKEIHLRKAKAGVMRGMKLGESAIQEMSRVATSGRGKLADLAENMRMDIQDATLTDYQFEYDDEQ